MLGKFFSFLIFYAFAPAIVWADDIRDVKLPVPWPRQDGFLLPVLILILLGGLLWVSRNMLFRQRETRGAPAPPCPWEVALQRLKALKERGLSGGEDVKNFYTELSDILRRYMEGRFHIPAPEMTSEEFLAHLKTTPVLNAQHKLSLQDFLNCCDMVKFAQFSSSIPEMEHSLNLVWQLVSETQPQA
ncbi:MAG: hypothetical protein WC450_04325 [Candidatus Omnitrophota bacterium]|jgi:hypothetical protein